MFCDKNLINGNKLRTCRKIQESYNLEIYLLLDLDKNVIINYTKIRISNSSLKIEQGRHNKAPLENRLCPLCLAEVENEFHFTVKCTSLYAVRDKLYDAISAIIPSFVNMTDESKGLGAIRAPKSAPPQMSITFSPKCIHNMCFSEINTVS